MFEGNEVAMVIVPLADGRFAVNAIRSNALNQRLGEFASRSEAEAWILQQSLAADEIVYGTGIIRPGDGQGIA
ncbi:MAG TPA: hypothetical protein VKQ29_04375 [Aliidongia sp.]|nr:hypothetical protein [Aliidongia sp.]